MENYSKGKNVEEPMTKETVPIPNLPDDFIWIEVKGGSKMRNLLNFAIKEFENKKAQVWSGSGPALGKTISCVEIVKRKFAGVHQFNKICYRRCEEHWDPKLDGLDPLVVLRDVPAIHILLSYDPINEGLPGYQGPQSSQFSKKPKGENRPKKDFKSKMDSEKFAALGLRSNYRKFSNRGRPSPSIKKD